MRQTATFKTALGQHTELKKRMLDWADQFSILLLLDSNEYERKYPVYECLIAVDAVNTIEGSLTALQAHHDINKDWLFGHICYDHKNELEHKLSSTHPEVLGFPSLHFFTPRIVCYISADRTSLTIEAIGIDPANVFDAIMNTDIRQPAPLPQLNFKQRTGKENYLSAIAHLRKHIVDGDCYEINYCN